MKLGLLGRTLSHSFSQQFFTDKFEVLQLKNHSYINIELDTTEDVKSFKSGGSLDLNGFNVTIPYKETVFELCDELSTEAKAIGAVNCVKIVNGKWHGFNTDSIGFLKSIAPFLEPQHSNALIFGTGGASKAIQYALTSKGIKTFVVGRTSGDLLLNEIQPVHLEHCKLLVNCTPVGMHPNIDATLPLPYEVMNEEYLAVDLIYNPEKTEFLQRAEKQSACIVNGKAMLHFQAEASWEIWNNSNY
jgi:shikimate dehydrogenase